MNLYSKLKEITNNDDEITIFIYGIHSPFLKAIYELKKIRNRLKTCLIVPDLPQFMSENKNPIYLILKKVDKLLINNYMKHIDSFVLLNDNMHEYLEIGNKPGLE